MEAFSYGMSDDPDDYYFKYDKTDKKLYYSKETDKRISKINIPGHIIDDIKEWDESCTLDDLIIRREALSKSKEEIEEELRVIVARIEEIKNAHPNVSEEVLINRSKRKKQDKQRKAKRQKQERETKTEEFFRKLFADHPWQQWWYTPPPFRAADGTDEPSANNNKDQAETYLKTLQITDRKSWFSWLKTNHPDKGGNVYMTQTVIENGRLMGW